MKIAYLGHPNEYKRNVSYFVLILQIMDFWTACACGYEKEVKEFLETKDFDLSKVNAQKVC